MCAAAAARRGSVDARRATPHHPEARRRDAAIGRGKVMSEPVGYEMTRHSVRSRHLAIVRERRRWTELGGQLIPILDRVYAAVRSGSIIQSGHNVFLYRDGSRDAVTVEVGVEVASAFDGVDGVVHSTTPPGEAVSTVHIGPYSALGRAYDTIVDWCEEHGLDRADVWWEVYGDWHEDVSQLRTEVYCLLRGDQS
jgi:effector-binding domain-containing protein